MNQIPFMGPVTGSDTKSLVAGGPAIGQDTKVVDPFALLFAQLTNSDGELLVDSEMTDSFGQASSEATEQGGGTLPMLTVDDDVTAITPITSGGLVDPLADPDVALLASLNRDARVAVESLELTANSSAKTLTTPTDGWQKLVSELNTVVPLPSDGEVILTGDKSAANVAHSPADAKSTATIELLNAVGHEMSKRRSPVTLVTPVEQNQNPTGTTGVADAAAETALTAADKATRIAEAKSIFSSINDASDTAPRAETVTAPTIRQLVKDHDPNATVRVMDSRPGGAKSQEMLSGGSNDRITSRSAVASSGEVSSSNVVDTELNQGHSARSQTAEASLIKPQADGAGRPVAPALTSADSGMPAIGATESRTTAGTQPVAEPDPLPIRITLPEGAEQTLKQDGKTVLIRIEPEHLGPARLKLSLANDVVTARVTVESPQAKATLEQSLNDLQQQLNRAGVKVDSLDINLAHDGSQSGREFSQSQSRESAARNNLAERILGDDESAANEAAPASPINSDYITPDSVDVVA